MSLTNTLPMSCTGLQTWVLKAIEPGTILEALQNGGPQISVLKKDFGVGEVVTVIETFLIGLVKSLNIPRNMRPDQCRETAQMIAQDFWYLNLADLNLAFKKIKSGQVQIYEGLDGAKIMSTVREYCSERDWIAESTSFQEHQKKKFEATNDLPMSLEVAQELSKLFPGKPKDADPAQPGKVHTEQEEIAALAQEYIRQEKKFRSNNPEMNYHQFAKENGTLEEWVKKEYVKLFPDAHKQIFE